MYHSCIFSLAAFTLNMNCIRCADGHTERYARIQDDYQNIGCDSGRIDQQPLSIHQAYKVVVFVEFFICTCTLVSSPLNDNFWILKTELIAPTKNWSKYTDKTCSCDVNAYAKSSTYARTTNIDITISVNGKWFEFKELNEICTAI